MPRSLISINLETELNKVDSTYAKQSIQREINNFPATFGNSIPSFLNSVSAFSVEIF
jgi:hypothetical protein